MLERVQEGWGCGLLAPAFAGGGYELFVKTHREAMGQPPGSAC